MYTSFHINKNRCNFRRYISLAERLTYAFAEQNIYTACTIADITFYKVFTVIDKLPIQGPDILSSRTPRN